MGTPVKLRSLAAPAIAVAIVAASTLGLAAPASAAPPAGVSYVADSDIVQSASFATNGWGNTTAATLTSTLSGLSMDVNTELFYGFTGPVPTVGGSTLRNVGDSSYFFVSDPTDVYAEISWYSDSAQTLGHYLRAILPGPDAFTDPSALWYSTFTVGTIPAFTGATLDWFDDAFAAEVTLADATIKAVGLRSDGAPVFLTSFPAGGNLFYFTPVPVTTGGAASIGQADFGTTGYSVTTTGFVPGETVHVYLATTESLSDPIDVVADSNGSVSYTWTAPVTNMDVGPYEVTFTAELGSRTAQIFAFSVVAQALAATGTDIGGVVVAGGILLLGGAAVALVSTNRRQRAWR